jgi:uncharacterized protein (TIGR03437 family)
VSGSLRYVWFLIAASLWAQEDPVVKYTRTVSRAEFTHIAVDSRGDIFALGRTNDAAFAASRDALQPRIGGSYDAVLVKFRGLDGEVLAATFFGGNGDEVPSALAVDTDGSVIIGGTTTSTNLPVSEGALQGTRPSNLGSSFVAKFDNGLRSREFSTYLGAPNGATRVTAVAGDRQGNALVAGTTDSRDFETTSGAFNRTAGVGMGFAMRLTGGGRNRGFATFLGTGSPVGIAADPQSNVVVAGTTGSRTYPVTADALQSALRGPSDMFVTRVNTAGALLYSTFLGGAGTDQAHDLVSDTAGIVYIAGVSYSTTFPGTNDVLGEVGTGVLLRLNGTRLDWTRTIRANGATTAHSLHLDGAGNIVVVGSTSGSHFPTTAGAHRRCVADNAPGGVSGFYGRYGQDGTLRYSTLVNENLTGADWAVTTADGDVITFNRPPSQFERLPASELRRYSYASASSARVECLVSAASYKAGTVTPGMIVTLFGSGMGPAEGVIMTLDANGKVPAAGAGVRVLFNGTPAPLLYVRQDQINAVVPFAVAGFDTARVQVENGQSALPPINVRVRSSDPGMFRLGSTEFGAVLNQNNSVNTPENAAERGSFITFWATGIGLFQSTFEDGGIVAEISSLRATVRVFFGGIEGDVYYSGAAPGMVAGVTQVNVRVPPNTRISSRVPVSIRVGDGPAIEVGYISVR